jgi:transcriptional regulator with XRE-family HTH domain
MTQEWSDGVHQRIAGAIRAARGEKRSAQDIANETERLGHKVSRDSITNIENGRKSTLDICELLILAAALGVPAVGLLLPNLPDGDVELLPGHPVSAEQALYALTGENEPNPQRTNTSKLLKLTRDRHAAHTAMISALSGLSILAHRGGEGDKLDAAREVTGAAAHIDELNDQLTEIPGAVVVKERFAPPKEGQE